MKHFTPWAIALLLISSCNMAVKPSKDEALSYNDKIITILNPYFDAEEKFQAALDNDESDIKAEFTAFNNEVDKITAAINAIPAFDSEDALKKATLEYLSTIRKTADTEYAKLVSIKTNPDYLDVDSEHFTDLADEFSIVRDNAEETITEAGKNFDRRQDAFAASYNFTIAR